MKIILALIDCHMIADPAWRHWLQTLANEATSASFLIVPIALDSTAFGAPTLIRQRNFLRPRVPAAPHHPSPEELELFERSLLKQLTEALCRYLLDAEANDAERPKRLEHSPLKLKVFLSHAKADGTAPARAVRDYIYAQTQLAAFYDENDIPFASAFGEVLQSEVPASVALIVVRTAMYAQRPWCRRELALFRRPRQDPPLGPCERWTMSPVLVLDALEPGAATVGISELGNSPHLRWSSTIVEQEEIVVTTLLRDALLGAFHRAVGATLGENPEDLVLNWLPDPVSLLTMPRAREPGTRIYYPGRLSGLDLDLSEELFPGVEFTSFEEASA